MLKKNQSRTLYPVKIFFKNEVNIFSDKNKTNKLSYCIASRPILEKMIKKILRQKKYGSIQKCGSTQRNKKC